MSSYTILKRHDKIPTVAILQKLLIRAGASLKVDADFGSKTENAVREFQRSRNLRVDGIVDGQVWARLSYRDILPLVDCIDVFDENLYNKQAQTVVRSGGEPIMLGGMSNGLEQAALEIGSARSIFLLRFIGHGCPGIQGVTIGRGGFTENVGGQVKSDKKVYDHSSLYFLNAPGAGASGLKKIFGPYSSVELHGCHVAAGPVGHKFIRDLAMSLQVPVSAGTNSQRSALRFDGPTYTAYPQSREAWCASLPDFAPITVP
jgi:hypothetical protein